MQQHRQYSCLTAISSLGYSCTLRSPQVQVAHAYWDPRHSSTICLPCWPWRCCGIHHTTNHLHCASWPPQKSCSSPLYVWNWFSYPLCGFMALLLRIFFHLQLSLYDWLLTPAYEFVFLLVCSQFMIACRWLGSLSSYLICFILSCICSCQ